MINQASPEFLYSFHIILIRKFHMFIYKLFPIFPQKLHSDSRLAHSKAIFLSSLKLLTYLSVCITLVNSVTCIKLKTRSVYYWNSLIILVLDGFNRAAVYPFSVYKQFETFLIHLKYFSPMYICFIIHLIVTMVYSSSFQWCKFPIPCEGISNSI